MLFPLPFSGIKHVYFLDEFHFKIWSKIQKYFYQNELEFK